MILLTSPEAAGGRVEITVRGDLDAVKGAELRRVIGGLGAATVELDLAQVVFIDCAGARTLLRADEHMRGLGQEMIVVRPSSPVLRLLRLLGFDRHLLIRHPGEAVGASPTPPGH
ncbi:STAS domain-containing protein [Streptosporangium sp. NPDC002721]|uniref:STAS domain-containing protein n=1 Tax=Streptosporangium sp. NPDC002721 TaxID=3366188 RepID=UPI0036ABE2F5